MTHTASLRRFSGALGALVLLLVVGSGGVSGAAAGVVLTPVVSGLDSPVQVTHAPDGSGRLFIVEQGGKVVIVKNGVLQPTPFINIAEQPRDRRRARPLSASHSIRPSRRTASSTSTHAQGRRQHRHQRVSRDSDPDVAARAALRRIITIDHPFANHNGGHIAFGPDGYLYIGTGHTGATQATRATARRT